MAISNTIIYNEERMIDEEIDKYIADFVQRSGSDEFKLLSEIGVLDEYLKELKRIKHLEILCRNRMAGFIELASDATGRPYIIDSGSDLAVAEELLFNLTDEWLSYTPKKVKDLIVDVLMVIAKVWLAIFAAGPGIMAVILAPLIGDPRLYTLAAISVLTIPISMLLWSSIDREIRKRKRNKAKKLLKERLKLSED